MVDRVLLLRVCPWLSSPSFSAARDAAWHYLTVVASTDCHNTVIPDAVEQLSTGAAAIGGLHSSGGTGSVLD